MTKHLTLSERIRIETALKENKTLGETARDLGKSCSTVSREIRNHIVIMRKGTPGHSFNECVHRYECKKKGLCEMEPDCVSKNCRFCKYCNSRCHDFKREVCSKLSKPPYVCNGCSELKHCTLEKHFYRASEADKEAAKVLKESREGFNFTEEELADINSFISEKVKNGLSVYGIVHLNPDEVQCSESTIYRLIKSGLLDARAIDLPRAVRFKPRKGKKKAMKIDRKCTLGRTYEDFQNFIDENPDVPITEMDSVEGIRGGKVLLTFLFRSCNLMLAFIRDRNNSQSVTDIINELYSILPSDVYQSLFGVLLTDNGTEFSNPTAIEYCGDIQRSRVFYCEPYSSYQKPHVEKNHEFIRYIIPKGHSMNDFSQNDIDLMMSHINSYPRKKLGGHSPYEVFKKLYGVKVLHLLRQEQISKDEIILNTKLLKK